MRLLLPLVVLSTVLYADAYKILVYNSRYGHSHSNWLGQIADTLVDAGHNVTSLIPIMDLHVKDGTEKSHKIYVEPSEEDKKALAEKKEKQMSMFTLPLMSPLFPIVMGPKMGAMMAENCRRVIEEPGLIEKLRAEQYDVLISENFDMCGMGLSHALKPKAVIGTSASALFSWQFTEFGIEPALSYRPEAFTSHLDVHSFFSRLRNLYSHWLGNGAFYFSRSRINELLTEAFGPDYPSVQEQSSNVAYVFTNSEPLLDFAAPTLARVVDVPGIAVKTPKPLDEHWESVFALRPKTVLLSFGSLAKSVTMPLDMKTGIVKTIANFPDVTFIWKYEEPEDEFCKEHAAKLKNLVLTKWMPQVDILNHKKLSLFITHGGMGSTQETALRGVPGIFIPIFGDQPRNAGMMEYNGFGKVFDKFDLVNADKFTAAIREVLENKKYNENAKRVSRMLAKKPFSSKQQLIKTVEFAAEFGPSSALRPQSIDMSFVAYHNLDVIVVFALLIAVLAFVSVRVGLSLVRRIARRVGKAKAE